MTRPTLPVEGGCRCGRVRLRLTAYPLLTMACHCTGCQRMTASAFSLSAAIPTSGFSVVQGETVIGGLHGASQHHFCAWCMSWLFTRPDGVDWFVNVRSTMLDEPAWWATPFMETWAAEKLPWATTRALHTFERLPANDAYPALLAAFATLE